MSKAEMENGKQFWAFGSTQYYQSAVDNFEEYLKKQDKMTLPPKIRAPVKNYYTPEIDISE